MMTCLTCKIKSIEGSFLYGKIESNFIVFDNEYVKNMFSIYEHSLTWTNGMLMFELFYFANY